MFNIRRAPLAPTSAPTTTTEDNAWDEYGDGLPVEERRLEDIVDALSVEFEQLYSANPAADPMEPVDLETGGVAARRAVGSYDQWDDEALDQIAQELSQFDDFDPQTLDPGVLPPHPLGEEAAAPRSRGGVSRGALIIGMVGVLGLGAVGWALFGDSGIVGFGEPVVVAAPTTPYKIVPKEGDTIDEPIDTAATFDPVSGLPPKGEERLVAREEEIPDLPGVTPQVNRVILPDGQEIVDEPVQPPETGPRRVRTVLVRPDGSIINAPDRQAPDLPSPTDTQLATESNPIADTIAAAEGQSAAGLPPLQPSEQVEAPADDPVAALLPPLPETPVDGQAVALAPAPEAPAVQAPAAPVAPEASELPDLPGPAEPDAATAAPAEAPPVAEAAPAAPVAEAPAAAAEVVDAPMPRVRPAPPPEPVAVAEAPAPSAPTPEPAAVPSAAPVDLTQVASAAPAAPPTVGQPRSIAPAEPEVAAVTPPAAEAPPAAPAAPAGSAYVQLSSQRSEEAALSAFRGLQSKHSGLLGGLEPNVQRADLGAKGIYYRVRVAQPSREAANNLCASLKSVGADCLIARR